MEQVDKDSWKILGKGIVGFLALIGLGFSFYQLSLWVLPYIPTELDPLTEEYLNWFGGFVLFLFALYWVKHRIKTGLLEADHGMLGTKRKYSNSTGEE